MPESKQAESTWVPGLPLAKEWHARASDVFHDNPACAAAAKVEMASRRAGTGGRARCEACAKSKGKEK